MAKIESSERILDNKNIAYFHLPGLFEFYELYKLFLPLFFNHREYFYEWCQIGSIYGAPADCIWSGGRISDATSDVYNVLDLINKYKISGRLTFSNSLLKEEHLQDKKCNMLCKLFNENAAARHGVIVHSDLLVEYLEDKYPNLYFVSSTTKVITEFEQLKKEAGKDIFSYVVPDFRFNKSLNMLKNLPASLKDKLEFLCNECCNPGCLERRECYEAVSRKNLDIDGKEHICKAPYSNRGYRFSDAMKNPTFISRDDILDLYLPMGFSNFKIEGRGLGSAIVLEFLLYYMVKPEYQINVREEIYLDSMLDLF